jgi:two-component system LytT family response regulator
MSTALIIEDENMAAQHLVRLLSAAAPDMQVAGVLQTVEESVEWFRRRVAGDNKEGRVAGDSQDDCPDVVFMDIHLADGLAFRIFDQVKVPYPIIFTTAYDQYALQAFQVNSIDYLLKPINIDDLHRALDKLKQRTATPSSDDLSRALEMLSQHYRQYKRFFLIPVRDKLVPLAVDQIACIYLDNKSSVALTVDGHTHPLDKPLEQIAAQLDPRRFFRVNRQYIVAHDAIKVISVWLLGKYSIRLVVDTPERIVLPKAKVAEFKDWYCQ